MLRAFGDVVLSSVKGESILKVLSGAPAFCPHSLNEQKFTLWCSVLREWSGLRLLRGALHSHHADARLTQDQV